MKEARSLGWFLVAGLLGLAVDVGVLYLAAPWLGWYAARALSFLAAATVTWRVNRRYAHCCGSDATCERPQNSARLQPGH